MKKALIIIAVIVAAAAIWAVSGYNGLVSGEENVKSAWSQVENVYQRRLDLIPNLVATVKGYAEHEQETLEGVIEARSKATKITVDPDRLTEENIAAYQEAQGEILRPRQADRTRMRQTLLPPFSQGSADVPSGTPSLSVEGTARTLLPFPARPTTDSGRAGVLSFRGDTPRKRTFRQGRFKPQRNP